MKQLAATSLVLLLLGAAAAFSVHSQTTSPADTASPLKIDVAATNPWSNLDLNNADAGFQFAIVTDRTGGRRPGIFDTAIDKLNMLQPEFVISVGDLIEGYSDDPGVWALQWSEFQSRIDRLEMPFFYCAGNHDISNAAMGEEWNRKFGRSYYSFVYHDVLFLVLNSEDLPEKGRPYQIGTAQQKWAIEEIDRHPDVRWTFVFLHKPTWTYTGQEEDPARLGWQSIEDALVSRQYTVFAGHKHKYTRYLKDGRDYIMLATTGGGSKLEEGIPGGRFDHFVWVTMKDDGPVIANLLVDGVLPEDVSTLPEK
jgi:hypothetical protein